MSRPSDIPSCSREKGSRWSSGVRRRANRRLTPSARRATGVGRALAGRFPLRRGRRDVAGQKHRRAVDPRSGWLEHAYLARPGQV